MNWKNKKLPRQALWAAALVAAVCCGLVPRLLYRPKAQPLRTPAHSVALAAVALTGDVTRQAAAPVAAQELAAQVAVDTYCLEIDQYRGAELSAFAVADWKAGLYTVEYTSADESICTVDANGMVEALWPGKTVITATATASNGSVVSAHCAVTVYEADPPLEAITLVRNKVKLRMGGTGSNLTVTGCTPERFFNLLGTPTYTSSDEAVCTVNEAGHITAVSAGEAVVTVSLYGVSAECKVTVLDNQLQPVGGIQMLPFSYSDIISIGNQTAGRCSWYALRYARTILDGTVNSGAGMWSNGAIWSAGGYGDYSGGLETCLSTIYSELAAGRPVIVHVQNIYVGGGGKHPNRFSTWEYQANGAGGWSAVEYPHAATTSYYGHWMCIVGISDSADPGNLKESDFFALDPARVTLNGNLVLTRMLDGTLWIGHTPVKVAQW